jgi:type I restriction enzyme S subunit
MAESIQYGHTASAVERKDGPRFLRITDIQDGCVNWDTVPSCNIPKEDIPKYRLASGDLVFARTGATTGKSFLIGECPEAVFASYLIRVRVSGGVDSRYLSAFFQSPDYWQQIEGGKRGIGQPNVNGTVLGQVQFPVAPLPEQRRIVAEIEKQFTRLEAGVAALRRVQVNLKRYRAAVLTAACEGRLVPTEAELVITENRKATYETGEALLARILTERRNSWRGRSKYKELAPPGTENLPRLPEGWAWATLESITLNIADVDHRMPKATQEGIPYVSTKDFFGENEIDFDRAKKVSESDYESLARKVKPGLGDILLSRYGTVGEVRPVKENRLFQASYSIAILKTHPIPVLNSFITHTLRSEFIRSQINRDVRASAQPDLGLAFIRKFVLPLPPLAEQARIVAEVERRLSVVDELDAMVTVNLKRAARLRQSILQKAFTGELTCDSESQSSEVVQT